MAVIALGQLATGQTWQTGEEGALMFLAGLTGILYLVVFITTVVLVCMWFHRATRHALARGTSLEVQSPAGAVASWFIPFVNLVKPFNIARAMLANAGLDNASVSTWQGLWVAGNIATNASNRIDGPAGLGGGVVSDLLLVGAGITAAQIVSRLKWRAA
jgi:preprotein translocase subunit SecG